MTASADRSLDVLVLGGGVVGLSCALYLLRAGRRVCVLEQGTIGCGSSHGNCGTITPSHAPPLAAPGLIPTALKWMLQADAPLHIAPRLDPALARWLLQFARRCNGRDYLAAMRAKAQLLLASRELLGALVRDERLDCEFVESGTMYVYRQPRAFEAAAALPPLLREQGLEVQVVDGAGARALEPALNDSIVGGHYFPQDARLRPDRYVAELARVVRGLGGEIREHTRITGFERDGGRVSAVHSAKGESFRARDLVFALGAWSPRVARALRLKLPIQPGKGYSITYTRPALWPRIPVVLREHSVCVTGWDSGFRLGSTMEFAGFDATLNPTRLAALKRAAHEYLREPEGPDVVEQWYGWRPMVYDDLPIIGRAPRVDNLWFATGHGMLGVSLSAVTGQLVSELVCERAPSLDLAAVRPERFA